MRFSFTFSLLGGLVCEAHSTCRRFKPRRRRLTRVSASRPHSDQHAMERQSKVHLQKFCDDSTTEAVRCAHRQHGISGKASSSFLPARGKPNVSAATADTSGTAWSAVCIAYSERDRGEACPSPISGMKLAAQASGLRLWVRTGPMDLPIWSMRKGGKPEPQREQIQRSPTKPVELCAHRSLRDCHWPFSSLFSLQDCCYSPSACTQLHDGKAGLSQDTGESRSCEGRAQGGGARRGLDEHRMDYRSVRRHWPGHRA